MSVSRSRIGSRLIGVGLQPVADAAHRLDRVATERAVDLLAQVADVDVDDVGPALERDVPGAVEKLTAREDSAGAAHEELEQRELLRRQLELGLAAPGAVRGRVEPQPADGQHRRPLHRRAPVRERSRASSSSNENGFVR